MRWKSLKLWCLMGLASSMVLTSMMWATSSTAGSRSSEAELDDLQGSEKLDELIDPVLEAGRFVLELDDGILVETIGASAGLG